MVNLIKEKMANLEFNRYKLISIRITNFTKKGIIDSKVFLTRKTLTGYGCLSRTN